MRDIDNDLPSRFPALWFRVTELMRIQQWISSVEARGGRAEIVLDHDRIPEVLEVTPLWVTSGGSVRWFIYRAVAGIWVDDINTFSMDGPMRLDDALALVDRRLELRRCHTHIRPRRFGG